MKVCKNFTKANQEVMKAKKSVKQEIMIKRLQQQQQQHVFAFSKKIVITFLILFFCKDNQQYLLL